MQKEEQEATTRRPEDIEMKSSLVDRGKDGANLRQGIGDWEFGISLSALELATDKNDPNH